MVTQDRMNLGKFFQLLYQFGQSHRDQEIAHDLNNHLSVLSMQVNMLTRALTREDRELAMRKSDEIQETAQRIQQFAEFLNQPAQQRITISETNLGQLIEETLSYLNYLPEIADVSVHWERPTKPVVVSCSPAGVQLTLLGFLYSVKQIVDAPQVHFVLDTKTGTSHRLTCTLQRSLSTKTPLKFPRQTEQLPGSIPLRHLLHNFDGESAGFRIELNEDDTLSVACIFH
ncbi:MAG: hypothetical protein K9N11_08180 [Lentisphaeria bacterium]|nr:hypothetical protein [Candidatus Neomarinimicrobiota bacterium]MCF7842813.1 hypothetical protein [Lentisphaeria bacterium]